MTRHTALPVAALLLAGCVSERQSDSAGGPPAVVRDSAGVQIVENVAPAWSAEDAWRVEEEALFVIRASDGGPENRLLDPTSIDVDSRGRIIVGDGDQVGWDAVLVYDSLGRFQFQAGRRHEFADYRCLHIFRCAQSGKLFPAFRRHGFLKPMAGVFGHFIGQPHRGRNVVQTVGVVQNFEFRADLCSRRGQNINSLGFGLSADLAIQVSGVADG